MVNEINGRKIAFLVAPNGVEHSELAATWKAVLDGGGHPVLVSTSTEPVVAQRDGQEHSFRVDSLAAPLNVNRFTALVVPGGAENAEALCQEAAARELVQRFAKAHKRIAAISHGPALLIAAGVLPGKVLTSARELEADITAAGAQWVDQPVHFCPDHGWMLVTAQHTEALPLFVKAMVTAFI